MPAAKTMLLLTSKPENKKELFTSLPSLLRARPDLELKYKTVYAYTHMEGVEYATDKCVIERVPIVYNRFNKSHSE